MGIVNITPDSFSDGGQFSKHSDAIDHARRLVDEGADLLDLGGESTRPGSEGVSAEEELRRILPVLETLVEKVNIPISIDTSKAAVARAALASGAEIINDVTAFAGDPEMEPLIVEHQPGVCLMHMRGTPRNMQARPTYTNVVEEVQRFLADRRDALLEAGLDAGKICLDPGIGFGKRLAHNLALLRSVDRFTSLGCPVLYGHSRKRYIGQVLDDSEVERMSGTIGTALALGQQGVDILRVHDVGEVRRAWELFEASGGT